MSAPLEGDSARWQIEVELPYTALGALEAALEDHADAILTEAVIEAHPLENRPDDVWRLRAIAADREAAEALAARAREALAGAGIGDGTLRLVTLAPRNWTAEVERDAPPIALGRFLIHGSHHQISSTGHLALRIDAGLAFGSGRHQTTRGCLSLIEAEFNRRRHIRRALDLGTGSGILAIAIARLWHCEVMASDIDPDSVLACRRAANDNDVGVHVRAVASAGFTAPALREGAPFDLIVANILAGPLVALAPAVIKRLDRRGLLVLSGLLVRQEAEVLAAYRARGCALVTRRRDGDWSTLGLRRLAGRAHWS